MAPRTDLQTLLEALSGVQEVYFQPPETVKMKYPCIVYTISNADTKFADNIPYRYTNRYQITVIDANPDSSIPGQVAMLPTCVFNRFFVASNLNHTVYLLYF